MQKNTKKHFNLTSKQLQTERRVKLENKETITDFSSILFLSAYFCFQPLFASKSPFYLSSPFFGFLLTSFLHLNSFFPTCTSLCPPPSLFVPPLCSSCTQQRRRGTRLAEIKVNSLHVGLSLKKMLEMG